LACESYRGRQIFRWLHKKKVFDLDGMTDLPKDLRQTLADKAVLAQLTPADRAHSKQAHGTHKTLFRLADGEAVESVLILHPRHTTLCLSTQVGCAVKCAFCATGLSGYTRNLSAGEIIEQALHILAETDLEGKTPNIVFMGMGEPFRNYDATMRSIRMLMSKDGLHIGARKITVSTVGEVPGIKRFADEGLQVRLSVSLHAATDALRSELVPLNRKYPLDKLRGAIEQYTAKTGRMITFEWTLLAGVNDTEEQADALIEIARDHSAKVNLIPYNPVDGPPYHAPTTRACKAFLQRIEKGGVRATLRLERGQDISAACGQLRRQINTP
jgi:23S rRNA (adenine2503-C2)-methyltransferase